MEDTFRLRVYGMSELAALYNPCHSHSWVRKCFNRVLQAYRMLRDTPHRQGWYVSQKVFTPRQVKTITRFLGEPCPVPTIP